VSDRLPGLRADPAARLVVGVTAVPDSIASAVLVGITPAHGLIAVMVAFRSPRSLPTRFS
jgi:MFS superfamily sulfate permease-like transporter